MSGWVWVAIGIGVVVVALVAVFGTMQWRRSAPDQRHPDVEKATKELYNQDPR
jgi:hypothetical protein